MAQDWHQDPHSPAGAGVPAASAAEDAPHPGGVNLESQQDDSINKPMDVDRLRGFLSRSALLASLSPDDLERVAEGASEVRLLRGQSLFQRGDPCVGFHVVVFGQVRLFFRSSRGIEKVVRLIGAGDSFGEALVFLDSPTYILSAQALADSLLVHVDKQALLSLLQHDHGLVRRMLASLSQRLHARVSDIEAYSLRTGMQRVIGYLMQGSACADGHAFRLGVSKGVIASRLNLTPEHFSRILHELIAQGLIRVRGRNITLLDVQALGRYQAEPPEAH